jgi:hypothetical protein
MLNHMVRIWQSRDLASRTRSEHETTKTSTTTATLKVVTMSDSSTDSDDEDVKKAIAMSLEDAGTKSSPAKPAASNSNGKAVSSSP